jgi:hypothetical protein
MDSLPTPGIQIRKQLPHMASEPIATLSVGVAVSKHALLKAPGLGPSALQPCEVTASGFRELAARVEPSARSVLAANDGPGSKHAAEPPGRAARNHGCGGTFQDARDAHAQHRTCGVPVRTQGSARRASEEPVLFISRAYAPSDRVRVRLRGAAGP